MRAIRLPNGNLLIAEPVVEQAGKLWTEAALPTRFFLWFLITFVSRRMGQLNFPISSLETSRGMTSEIVQLAEPRSGRIVYTGWLRALAGSGRVIYAGFYSDEQPGAFPSRCVR